MSDIDKKSLLLYDNVISETKPNNRYPTVDNALVTEDGKWSLYDIWMESKSPLGATVPSLAKNFFPKLLKKKFWPNAKLNHTIQNG